jgi:hypothetical protein
MTGPLYVYGLIRPEDRAGPALEGLGSIRGAGPAAPAGLAPVEAVVSPLAEETEILPTRRNMLAHARILEACLAAAPVLPVRFGLVCPDAQALAAALAPQAAALLDRLAALEGRAEFGLTVTAERDPAIAAIVAETPDLARKYRALPASGPAAHFARVELGREVAERLDQRRHAAQDRLLARLAPLAQDHVLLPPETDTDLLRAAFLLPLAALPEFEAAIARAAGEIDFAPGSVPAIRLVGPAPASRFVSIRLEAGAAATV